MCCPSGLQRGCLSFLPAVVSCRGGPAAGNRRPRTALTLHGRRQRNQRLPAGDRLSYIERDRTVRMPMPLKTKRWNDPVAADDGVRLLVCRYGPRGVRKDAETWDQWL